MTITRERKSDHTGRKKGEYSRIKVLKRTVGFCRFLLYGKQFSIFGKRPKTIVHNHLQVVDMVADL